MPFSKPRRNLPGYIWLLAYLAFPAFPYIALYFSGAITRVSAILYFILVQSLSLAFVFSMVKTETNRDVQQWVLISMTLFFSFVAGHQFYIGNKWHLWPRAGIRVWKTMAIIGIVSIVLIMTSAVLFLIFPELK